METVVFHSFYSCSEQSVIYAEFLQTWKWAFAPAPSGNGGFPFCNEANRAQILENTGNKNGHTFRGTCDAVIFNVGKLILFEIDTLHQVSKVN